MRRHRRVPAWPTALLMIIVLAACGGTATPTPRASSSQATVAATPTVEATLPSTASPQKKTPTPSLAPTEPRPDTTPEATVTLNVYFIRDEKIATAHRQVPETPQVGSAAMRELLAGPNAFEQGIGMTTSIPEGTQLLGLEVADQRAVVDLSEEFESGGGSLSVSARLAQVVYTLTQFPTVDVVEFRVAGRAVDVFSSEGIVLDHPVGRDAYEDLTPLILVEAPAPGDEVGSPIRVTGTANTFEATFQLALLDADGQVVAEQTVQATSGSGMRGTFDTTIWFGTDIDQTQSGTLQAFEYSARDGSVVNLVEIPLTLQAP